MKKSIVNRILTVAVTYAVPLLVNYIVNKFFNKKQKAEAKQISAQP